jgi:protein-tyrosine phosphatase
MIDIHSHLLPGVDDGSRSIEASVEVLTRFASDGVDVLVCTPHLLASEAASAPVDSYREILESLRAAAPAVPRLELGWEIMLDIPGTDLSAPGLALAGSTAVLVEFTHAGVPPGATEELTRLRASGVVPVLAHPERYWGCTPESVAAWRRAGAVMQVDVVGLLAGGRMGALATELLQHGLVDCFASDNHADGQALAVARRWLEDLGAGAHAHLLTTVNPGRLLQNEPPLPVPPLVSPAPGVGRSMFRHLRALVRKRRAPARDAPPVEPGSR